MLPEPEPERDSFDQWISWVLTEGSADALPSDQVWQRIVRMASASQVWAVWRKRWAVPGPLTWMAWSEHRDHFTADTHLIGVGWWLFFARPLPYSY